MDLDCTCSMRLHPQLNPSPEGHALSCPKRGAPTCAVPLTKDELLSLLVSSRRRFEPDSALAMKLRQALNMIG